MYGDKGPPKGYSVPRYDGGASRMCQHCSSTDHWTYECTRKKKNAAPGVAAATSKPSLSTSATARLSRTQMLKYGVKRRRAEFVPEETERELYNREIKALEKALIAEVREEFQTKKERLPDAADRDDAARDTKPIALKEEVNPPDSEAEPPSVKREPTPHSGEE